METEKKQKEVKPVKGFRQVEIFIDEAGREEFLTALKANIGNLAVFDSETHETKAIQSVSLSTKGDIIWLNLCKWRTPE